MRSSRTISLFTERPEPRQTPYSLVVSVVVHASGIAFVLLAFLYSPQFKLHTPDVYALQHIQLNAPDLKALRSGGSGSLYPSKESKGSESSSSGKLTAPSSSRLQLNRRKLAPQTLVEPDVDPDKMLPKEAPLPAMLLWAAKQKLKVVTPPPPTPPVTTFDKPKLTFPNKEERLADVNMASTTFPTKIPMPMPSKTSPVVLHRDVPLQRIPETSSISSIETASTAVLSDSDLRVAQGRVALPPANQSAAGNLQGALGTGTSSNGLQSGNGNSGSTGTDKGEGKGQGTAAGPGTGAGKNGGQTGSGNGSGSGLSNGGSGQGSGQKSGSGSGTMAGNGSGQGSGHGNGKGSGDGDDSSITRISLPKNGQFNVVVVGSEIEEEYPDAAPVWNGRLAYSVYLHVGTAKNWILQYSLPRAADSANSGSIHLEAPWPYYIVRPNIGADDVDADAVMVHGFVNEAGHFETLDVVFPSDFPHAHLVLNALKQWQFRPGTQNGQIARLEVLLIIPEVSE